MLIARKIVGLRESVVGFTINQDPQSPARLT
jgi:hypothetical protein